MALGYPSPFMCRRHLSTVPKHLGQTGVARDGRGSEGVIQRRDLATWTKIFHLLRVSMISDKMRAGDGGPGQQRPDGGLRLDLLLAAARPWVPLTWMDGRGRARG